MLKKHLGLVLVSILVLSIFGCAKSKLINIQSEEDISMLKLEEIIDNKDLTTEEKAAMLQIKIAEDIRSNKKAVEIEKDTKLASIIHKPITPTRTPPIILRILLLPYENSVGVLSSWKYSFLKVDDGDWIISDYLNSKIVKDKKVLTPLDQND